MELFQKKKNKKNLLEWEVFPPYDIKSAEKRLRPEDRAHEFATSDSRTEVDDDTRLTSPEIEMVADVNDHILQLSNWHTQITGEAQDVVTGLTEEVDADLGVKKIRSTFRKKVNQSLTKFKYDVDNIYLPLKNAYHRMNAFQLKHCISNHRAAEYPDSVLYHFAFIFVMLFVESIVNCFFFAKGSVYGYWGGFWEAFLIALANVVISGIAGGFFLRQFNYIEKNMNISSYIKKCSGLVCFICSLFVLLFLHLSAAHYRESILRTEGLDVVQTAEIFKYILAHPLGLHDLQSFILIILGGCISVCSIWKGYTVDDRFPGYGKVYRTWKLLDEEMAFFRNKLQHDISGHYDDAVDASHEVLGQLISAKKQLEGIQGKINAMLTSCAGHYDQAYNGAVSLLTVFRRTVQQIYNNPNRFCYSDALLHTENGLKKINFSKSRADVEGLLVNTIDDFEKMAQNFPAKQDVLLEELENEQIKFLDDAAIDSMIQRVKDRKEKQAVDLKDENVVLRTQWRLKK